MCQVNTNHMMARKILSAKDKWDVIEVEIKENIQDATLELVQSHNLLSTNIAYLEFQTL